ncbi:hypothetical protein [Nannocystis pusilla]|uniref:Uncharacterized protein n=1 Tax=Nannocystis pusilla TaxID=889268 RepID=A0ABS7U1P0_9BACT|nr:hypothetical protein [Nannocystis pusilla]MBZ5714257.1 hypothetical protein [Nannocystis pusilla]
MRISKHNIVAAITTLIMAVSGSSLMSGCNKQQTDTANPEPVAAEPSEPAPVDPVAENPPDEPAAETPADPAAAAAPPAEGEAPAEAPASTTPAPPAPN